MRRTTLVVILACLSLLVVVNVVFLSVDNPLGIARHVATKAGDAHRALTDKPGKPKQPTYTYNRDQRAPAYNEGMEELKEILSELADITPGAGPYGRKDYQHSIGDEESLVLDGELPMTSEVMKLFLQVNQSDVAALKLSHSQVMERLPSDVVPNAFGGRGIVLTGGGPYFPMVLTAIQWVRQNDSNIPIEVFMRDESEYEKEYCDGVFKDINVECVVADKIYGSELSKKVMSAYALKPLAILASKFDDIYFMDADSLPVLDVNDMFDSKLYKDTGYLLDRDYWARYVSPHYYDIVGLKLGERVSGSGKDCGVLLQKDRKNAIPGMSTESGQIFVNKSKHIRSLILAMYYNMYGPGIYFPLLMMGGPGEGDKDTYAAAAWVCNETYYQNADGPRTLGWHEDGKYTGVVMVQPDPRSDYEKHVEGKSDTPFKAGQLHSANLKTNIRYMLDNSKGMRGFYLFRKTRYYSDVTAVTNNIGAVGDVELRMFEAMRHTACEWGLKDNAVPKDWEGQDVKKYCRILSAHVDFLKKNSATDENDRRSWVELDAQGKLPEPHVSHASHTSHASQEAHASHVPHGNKE